MNLKRKIICTVQILGLCILFTSKSFSQNFTGKIVDGKNKENINGATVFAKSTNVYAKSNSNGVFKIKVKPIDTLRISMVGYASVEILINRQTFLEISLTEQIKTLDEVIINENLENNFRQNITKITNADINKVPTLFGEKDLVKAIQILPGVKSIVEGASGFSVRGGTADQNLLLLDEVPLYSYSHLFGLFTMINPDVVKDVEFMKEGIPAKYGGRAASILKINLKDGDTQNWHSDLNLGFISSKIAINGPIIKNKLTFVASIRRSYLDVVAKPFVNKYSFPEYILKDYNVKLSYRFNQFSKLTVGNYYSKDKYTEYLKADISDTLNILNNDGFDYINELYFANYYFSKGIFNLHFGLHNSGYQFNYNVARNEIGTNSTKNIFKLDYNSKLLDNGFKINSDVLVNKNTFSIGGGISQKKASALYIIANPLENILNSYNNKPIVANESYLYFSSEIPLKNNFFLTSGIRYTYFDSKSNSKNLIEPRVSINKQFISSGYRFSYTQMRQFVHLLSSSGGGLPSDIWINANSYAKPSLANQISVSYYKNFKISKLQNYLEISTYFKTLQNVLEYNNGQNILTITEELANSDTNLRDIFSVGKGKAYGLELLYKSKLNKVDLQFAYTLSRAFYKFDQINKSERYYPKFDRLHEFNLLFNYEINNKIKFNNLINFGTASPVTLPNGAFYNLGYGFSNERYGVYNALNLVSLRNNYRSEVYFRMDFSISFEKQKRRFLRVWEVGAYNTTARKNPFYYTSNLKYIIDQDKFILNETKKSFLSIIPNINYKIKF